MAALLTPELIIEYWYSDRIKSQWFKSSKELDEEIKSHYENVWEEAVQGKHTNWSESADGCLALAIIFDQFPLNMFRGNMKSFSSEGLAIKVAKIAIDKGFDQFIAKEKVAFLYMPLMHSENIDDQNFCVKLFEQANLLDNLRFAKHHRDIILKFGRFPHRNKILNRQSSEDELDYLNSEQAFKG